MIENRVLTMEDYGAMLRRRLKVILIPAVLAPIVGFLISYAFPAKYMSQALILVQEQQVPQGYVAPVVTADLSQRIATLEQKALGADRLRPMIEKLKQQGLVHGNDDDIIERIRNGVSIEQVQMIVLPNSSTTTKGTGPRPGLATGPPPSKTPQVPAFNLDFTASDPKEAQAICAGLADIMLQENLKERLAAAQNTADFLGRQVDDAKHNLDDLDSKLADFKKQYLGQLPSDEDSNLKLLSGLNSQLDASTQALNRAQQDKTYSESLLSQQLAAWRAGSSSNPQTLQQQLDQAQAQLVTLQERYTDDYPDVVKTKKQIADLQKRLDEVNSAAPNSGTAAGTKVSAAEPAEIQQLRLQIHQYEQVIAQATREQKNLQGQIKVLQGRIAVSPAVEERYKQLTRDYDTAQKFYDDLLQKKNESEMQRAMESEQEGEQMRLQIPADLPDSPSFPNRLMFAGGGLGAGLALGIGFGLLLELRDKSLRNEGDVIAALELPVLSQVPWVGADPANHNGNGNGNGNRKFGSRSHTRGEAGTIEV
ncbi:MAG TPA: lipopolysaccharide biosynthesis protein [Terriglobales bacterium]|nr:lipopolysaccharide biosynthesis protein [Terriglobales bacterium]